MSQSEPNVPQSPKNLTSDDSAPESSESIPKSLTSEEDDPESSKLIPKSSISENALKSSESISESPVSEEGAPESSVLASQGRTSKKFRLVQRNLRIAGEAYITSSQKQIPAKQQPSDVVRNYINSRITNRLGEFVWRGDPRI